MNYKSDLYISNIFWLWGYPKGHLPFGKRSCCCRTKIKR